MKLSKINEIQLHAPTKGMLRNSISGTIWAGSINPQPVNKKRKIKQKIKRKVKQ